MDIAFTSYSRVNMEFTNAEIRAILKFRKKNLMDRISICESLLNRNKTDPFLKRIVTGDEKWVTYDNVKRKRSWSKADEAAQTVAKPGLTARKVLLCVWWDWKGIIHYELLRYGQTLNADLYCQQLDRLKKRSTRSG